MNVNKKEEKKKKALIFSEASYFLFGTLGRHGGQLVQFQVVSSHDQLPSANNQTLLPFDMATADADANASNHLHALPIPSHPIPFGLF